MIAGVAALATATCLASTTLLAQETLVAQTVVECPGLNYAVRSGIAGLVREEGSQVAIPRAQVVATWTTPSGERGSLRGESDEQGVYTLCGLPTNTSISIRALFADFVTEPVSVRIEPGPPAGWDFKLAVASGERSADAAFPGRIVGLVTDRRSGRPVEAAAVTLVGDEESRLSNGVGGYSFENLTPGIYHLSIKHVAYEAVDQIVNVPGSRTVEVNVAMSADPIELEPLVVTVVRNRRLELRGYYERRDIGEKMGMGVFFDQKEIRRRGSIRVTHLLGQVNGVRADCRGYGNRCQIVMTRGASSLSSLVPGGGCRNSNVWVDGVHVIRDNQAAPESIDNLVSPWEITGLEVYRSAAEVPAEFGGSVGQCGAIVIWTGSG